jgi:hypothetical protein
MHLHKPRLFRHSAENGVIWEEIMEEYKGYYLEYKINELKNKIGYTGSTIVIKEMGKGRNTKELFLENSKPFNTKEELIINLSLSSKKWIDNN